MGCDTICDLPDSLLTQILLYLPTRDSVRTSVLSTRWRNLWLSVPGLDVATCVFCCGEDLARFVDRFMEFNHGSRLQSFKIWYGDDFRDYAYNDGYRDRFMELIGTVVDSGIQHLDVDIYPHIKYAFMSQNIYKSNTLVSLKLGNVELKNPEFVVSLPCLKIMRLVTICYGMDGPLVLEKLISGCPVLEDLELIRPFDILNQEVMLFLRVTSQTLKKCILAFGISLEHTDFTVEIDAPRLKYMTLFYSQSDRVVVKNLSSLCMFHIYNDYNYKCDILSPLQPEKFRKRGTFYDFLTGISSVRHMIICEMTLKFLYCYSKLETIPQFHNLYYLQAYFSSSSLQLLPALLESCPNLKNLIFDFPVSQKREKIDFHKVPQCLMLTLEYVKIKELIMKEKSGIKLVNYFLENSAVLKKLTLSFTYYSMKKKQEPEPESYKKLLTSTKLSPTCQVIIE